MMNCSAPMKTLFRWPSKGVTSVFGIYWADKRFTHPGLYVWWRYRYVIRPKGARQ